MVLLGYILDIKRIVGCFQHVFALYVVKICDMTTTVRGMIENLLTSVSLYGFVPNGGRVYYLDRSQPPLLPLMVEDYVDATDDTAFFCDYAAAILDTEHDYWINRHTDVSTGLAFYEAFTDQPRPGT